ncbi:MAG: substrate-binding domain-containing protein, partial [Orrella sp.]
MPAGSNDNTYWIAHPKGIEKAVEELHPFQIDINYFLFDLHNENDFIEKTREVLKKKPDGVIIAPILKKEALHFCNQLDDFKIPYVFIDTFLENTNCISFIGEDAFQGGRVAASLIDYGLSPE